MNKKSRAYATAVLILVLLIASVYILTHDALLSKKSEKEPIKIGLIVWPGYGPLYIAQEKKFFEKNNVSVELVIFDYTTLKSIMMSNQIDGYITAPDTIQAHADTGISSVTVLPLDYSDGADGIITADDTIRDIKDLRGKKIAFEKGSISNFFLSYLLRKENMTTKDIVIIDMQPSDAASAFAAGKVDTAITWEPWLSVVAKKRPGGRILVTTKQTPQICPSVLSFRKDVVTNRPEEVRGIMRAWFEALDYIEENPEESYDLMAKSLGLTTEEFLETKSNVQWFDYNSSKDFLGTPKSPGKLYDVFDTAGETWVEEGLIEKKVNGSQIVNSSFIYTLYA